MPTSIVKTIGSGGDYADIATAFAALPASLVTADEQWTFRFKNQEHANSAQRFISNKTTDATRYIVLEAESGAEWWANTSNPLAYGYGARIRHSDGGGGVNNLGEGLFDFPPYTVIRNLQWKITGTTGGIGMRVFSYGRMSRCYLEVGGGVAGGTLQFERDDNWAVNCIIVSDNTSGTVNGILGCSYLSSGVNGGKIINNTFLRPTDRSTSGVAINSGSYGETLIRGNRILGSWSYAVDKQASNWDSGSGYNATSLAAGSGQYALPGSNNTHGLTPSTELEGVTSSSINAKLKSGFTSLTGVRDQTYTADVDIYGTARSTTAPQIGAQESIPTGGGITLQQIERGRGVARGLGRGL